MLSSVNETRMVSPIPSAKSEPIPIALLIRASSPSPASVTPRWMGKFQGALYHAEGGITVAVHDPIAERAVIRSDSHGDTAFHAQAHQRGKSLPNAIKLGRVLLVGVLDNLEFF